MTTKILPLSAYIAKFYGTHHGAQTDYAAATHVKPQQVTKWLTAKFNVSFSDDKHQLQSPKREIPTVIEAYNNFDIESAEEYPIFCQYEGQQSTQRSYLKIDIRTGAVSADYASENGCSMDEHNSVELTFPCDPKVSKGEINDYITANLSKFQRLLSIFKEEYDGSNFVGRFIDGFEDDESIMMLSHDVESNLVSIADYVVTSFNDVNFDCSILDTPVLSTSELKGRIDEYLDGFC